MTKAFCNLATNTRLMDTPNDRSSHATPTVRGGGVVFIGIALLALPFLAHGTETPMSDLLLFIICILSLASVSFLDDLYTLSVKPRFFSQLAVALLVAIFMRPEQLDFQMFAFSNPLIIIPFLILAVLWSINHFNFMDGIDGICALQALFLLGSYALLLEFTDGVIYQEFCMVLISALLGFLVFNFPPAKLFMGDVGSATLGFIVFVIAVIAQQKYQIPIVYWFMLNGLFLFDTTVTLLRRIAHKEQWSVAHRKHAYQRLKQSGLATKWILLGQAGVNLCLLVLVLMAQANTLSVAAAILIELSLITMIYLAVEKKCPMYNEVAGVRC